MTAAVKRRLHMLTVQQIILLAGTVDKAVSAEVQGLTKAVTG